MDEIDADKMLDAGQVPLGPILRRAKALEKGEILRVLASFRPIPLVDKLIDLGYKVYMRPEGVERFVTYIESSEDLAARAAGPSDS